MRTADTNGRCGDYAHDHPCRMPSVDVSRHGDEEYVVRCELPGVSREDLDITIDDNRLTIAAKRSWKESGKVLLQEIPERDFRRTFILSHNLDRENISAELARGVLTLLIPRDRKNKKRIQITDNDQLIIDREE